ncbi:MAG: hypothetical protein WBG63_10790, partial [Phormidesmis sp.]
MITTDVERRDVERRDEKIRDSERKDPEKEDSESQKKNDLERLFRKQCDRFFIERWNVIRIAARDQPI